MDAARLTATWTVLLTSTKSPDIPADVYRSPVVVWVGIGVVCLVLVATAFPKVFGPISKTLSDWAEQRRRSAQSAEDVRIADREQQNTYLREELDEARRLEAQLRGENAAIRSQSQEHVAWDWSTRAEVLRLQQAAGGAQDWPAPPAIIPPPVDEGTHP